MPTSGAPQAPLELPSAGRAPEYLGKIHLEWRPEYGDMYEFSGKIYTVQSTLNRIDSHGNYYLVVLMIHNPSSVFPVR